MQSALNRPAKFPHPEQEFLLTQPLAQFSGKRIDIFTGDFQPGARTPLHRHPGTEILYVLEGNGEMIITGHDSRPLTKGTVVLVEPAQGEDAFVHAAINRSPNERMKTLVVVIHDEGTPIATPAPDSQP